MGLPGKQEVVSWDWKEQPMDEVGGGALGRALKRLGIHVYPTPSDEGSDQFGFVLSTEPLTKKQVKKIDKAHNG